MKAPTGHMPSLQNPPNINSAVPVKNGPNYMENCTYPDPKPKAKQSAGTTGSMSQDALVEAAHSKMKAGVNHYEHESHMKNVGGKYVTSMLGNGTKRK